MSHSKRKLYSPPERSKNSSAPINTKGKGQPKASNKRSLFEVNLEKSEIEARKKKILEKIEQDPKKAAEILKEWMKK